MGCGKLIDLPRSYMRDEWLTKVVNRSPPEEVWDTIRANPDLWKEDLVAEVYGITKEEKGMSLKMEKTALDYFVDKPDTKEGCKFSD
jgi:hypothetical protein